MKRKNFLFVAALFAALSLGFVSCENPDDDKFGNSTEQSDDNETPDAPDSGDDDTDSPVSCFTPAAFSVSSTEQVYFSSGNLQYTQSTNTWSFASAQWEIIGTDNVTGGEETFDERFGYVKEGTALADKVDLFGWSTSAINFGVSTSTNSSDYSGSFVDWGTNQIGDDVPNTWRTLTYDEWYYLLKERTNASSLIGIAEVNGVNGLILLPDGWTCPDGITFKSGFYSNYGGVEYYYYHQTFTLAQWQQMEAAGAVFLPAAGYRLGSRVNDVQIYGRYWSATETTSELAYGLYFRSDGASRLNYGRNYGHSVRLVKDL